MDSEMSERMREMTALRLEDATQSQQYKMSSDPMVQLTRSMCDTVMWMIRDWPGQEDSGPLHSYLQQSLAELRTTLKRRPAKRNDLDALVLLLSDAVLTMAEQWPVAKASFETTKSFLKRSSFPASSFSPVSRTTSPPSLPSNSQSQPTILVGPTLMQSSRLVWSSDGYEASPPTSGTSAVPRMNKAVHIGRPGRPRLDEAPDGYGGLPGPTAENQTDKDKSHSGESSPVRVKEEEVDTGDLKVFSEDNPASDGISYGEAQAAYRLGTGEGPERMSIDEAMGCSTSMEQWSEDDPPNSALLYGANSKKTKEYRHQPATCKECAQRFKNKKNLYNHLRRQHDWSEEQVDVVKMELRVKRVFVPTIPCRVCTRMFFTDRTRKKHEFEKHSLLSDEHGVSQILPKRIE